MLMPGFLRPRTHVPVRKASMRDGWVTVQTALGLGVLIILFLHADTVRQAVSVWNRSETYSMGWVVLPTLGYLLWHSRERISVRQPVGSIFGVMLAVLFSIAWLAADLMNIAEGRQLALIAILWAVVLAAVGWNAFVVLIPFLALLVFLVPSGGFLLAPLKHITVGFIGILGAIPGMPIATEGFAVYVDSQRYVVIDDCAGLPYLLLGLFLGLTLALLNFRTWWKIALLVVVGGALAILANGLRVVSIVAYDYLTGSELDFEGHVYFGWIANGIGFLVLFLLFSRLAPERETPLWQAVPPGDRVRTSRAVGLLVLALLPVTVVPTVATAVANVAIPPVRVGLPSGLVGWQQQPGTSDWQPGSHHAAAVDSLAHYAKQGERLTVFMAQAVSHKGKVSGGGIDLVGGDRWMRSRQETRSVCPDERCLDVIHLTLVLRDSTRVRHVYTLYALGSESTVSPLLLRLGRAWARLRGQSQAVRLLAIASDNASGLGDAEVGVLLQHLLGHTSPAGPAGT